MNERTAPTSGNEVSLTLPTAWSELTDDALRYVTALACIMPMMEVQGYLFARLCQQQDARALLADESQIGLAVGVLDWLQVPPSEPVRLQVVGGCHAVDALLHGVAFGHYIMIENYYQGFVLSEDPRAIDGAARLLYPGLPEEYSLQDGERYAILLWLSAVKESFSREWPHFFRHCESGGEMPDMKDVMNAEIRALTGGDVTKEEHIHRIDCWRALTELNEKAREAADLDKRINQK